MRQSMSGHPASAHSPLVGACRSPYRSGRDSSRGPAGAEHTGPGAPHGAWPLGQPAMTLGARPGGLGPIAARAASRRERPVHASMAPHQPRQACEGAQRPMRYAQSRSSSTWPARLQLLGQAEHPAYPVVGGFGQHRPPGRDHAGERRGPQQDVGERHRPRCRGATSSTIARSSSGPGGSATPATTRRHLGAARVRPRTHARPAPGRRTPTTAAGRAATGSRRASRHASPTTPRRSPRCPRCRRGARAARRRRRRRSPARRAPAASAARSAASLTRSGSVPRRERVEELRGPRGRRWWRAPSDTHIHGLACAVRSQRQQLADADVADLAGGAELRGPQRDPELLELPAHLAERGAGRASRRAAPRRGAGRPPAAAARGRASSPVADGRPGRPRRAARGGAGSRRGRPGSAAAAPRRHRRRTRRATSRPSCACMSESAGSSASSARPLSNRSVSRCASSTREQVRHQRSYGARRGPAASRSEASSASYCCCVRTIPGSCAASTASIDDRAEAVGEQPPAPRGTASPPAAASPRWRGRPRAR